MSRPATRRAASLGRLLTNGFVAFSLWVLSRALMALLWSNRETFIDHDVRYYFWQLDADGVSGALVEYPTPIAVFLDLIRITAGRTENAYVIAFVLIMVILDGAVTVWLWRSYSKTASAYWGAYTWCIGSLIWFRIDLLPAVAVLASLVWVTRRPIASGAAVAVGAATKLWPAMLIAPMLGTDRWGKRRGLGFLIAGGLLGLGSVLFFGWTRSISPVTWQSDRGLQIESIVATVPMIRHAFISPDLFHTELSQYNAWEIFGPGVDFWLSVADWMLVGSVLLAVALGWLIALGGMGLPHHRLPNANDPDTMAARTHAIVLAQIALICATIIENKTFSPQYMIWLGGPLAILLSLSLPRRDRIQARWLAILGLICAAMTHLVFPLNYSGLISQPTAEHADTVRLVVRNLLVIALCVASVTMALKSAWRIGRDDPQVASSH